MKGDGKCEMNTVKKQCVVHVSRETCNWGHFAKRNIFLAGRSFTDFKHLGKDQRKIEMPTNYGPIPRSGFNPIFACAMVSHLG
jgi:hypothetical protein